MVCWVTKCGRYYPNTLILMWQCASLLLIIQNSKYLGNVNPIGLRSCYDEGKRAAETLFFDYHRQHGLDIRVVRIFNTYGPNMAMNDGRVVSNFILQLIRNEPITVYEDGSQTLSFCYVGDMVDGNDKYLKINYFNLGFYKWIRLLLEI